MRLTVGELKAALEGLADDTNVVLAFPERTANLKIEGHCSALNQFILLNVPRTEDAFGFEKVLTRWYET